MMTNEIRIPGAPVVRVTDDQVRLLAALYTAPGPVRQGPIARIVGAAPGSIGYRLDALSAKGLAQQEGDERRWTITPAGRRVVHALAGRADGPSPLTRAGGAL